MLKKPITSRESDSNNTWQELQDTIGEIRYEWLESTDFRNFTREESIQELKSIIWEFFEMTSIFRQNPEKWKKIAEDFFNYISQFPWFDIDQIQSIGINQARMKIDLKNSKQIVIDLANAWDEIVVTPEKQKIQTDTREQTQKLRETVDKDSFFGGNIIFEYGAIGGTAALATKKIIDIRKTNQAAKEWLFQLNSLLVQMDDGKTMRIHLSDERPIIGTHKDFQDSVGRILERAELQLDPTTRKVFFPAKKMLQALDEDFWNLTYEKYLKENENIQEKMTREEFEKFRQEKIIENRQMIRDFDAGKITSTKILKSVGHIAMHAAMLPLFAVQYHRHQTAANMVEAVGEEVAFAIGAKVVGKAASKAPGVWKAPAVIVGSLAGGIGAVWAGHTFSEKMLDAKRHKWLTFQKSNYENKRSRLGHIVFGMGVNEGLGYLNDGLRYITEDSEMGGLDIGIDRMSFNNPFTGKHLFTTPEMSIFQDKVTLGTEPWTWMQTAANRDVNRWNEYVERYKTLLKTDINTLLGEYKRDEGIFSDSDKIKEKGSKEKLLESELYEVLRGGESGISFVREMATLVNLILQEVKNWTPAGSREINDYIDFIVNQMKIDRGLYLYHRKISLNEEYVRLISSTERFSNLTPELTEYIKKIPERIYLQQEIYQNNTEKNMYESMLKNKNTIERTDENGKKIQVTVGNEFAIWLDEIVAWNQEKYFLEQIEAGNTKGFEWK